MGHHRVVTVGRETSNRGSAVRPVVATAEIVALGLLAHAGAGGTLPGSPTVLTLVTAVAAASFALHLQLVRLATAATLTVVAQLAVHVAGSTGAPHEAGHAHLSSAAATGDRMVLAHVASALVTVLVLVWQERAVEALVRALVPRPAVALSRPAPRRPVQHLRACLAQHPLERAPHRGPPARSGLLVS